VPNRYSQSYTTEYRTLEHYRDGLESDHFHSIARFNQPDRHRRRFDRNDRMVEVRSVANSDSDFSGYHDIDERNGVLFPSPNYCLRIS
jgi:hypothetical protein